MSELHMKFTFPVHKNQLNIIIIMLRSKIFNKKGIKNMAKTLKAEHKKARIIRYSILLFVLLLSTVMGLLHQFGTSFKAAPIDAFCPFGGLESLYIFITAGGFLKRIALSSFILLIATIVLAFVFRRTFCGNICPLGTLQEFFEKLRGKFFRKRFVIPEKADKYLRYLKYLILVLVLEETFRLGYLVIRPYDPWAAYHHIASADLFIEFPVGFAVLLIALAGSFLYDRFFCKYMCPMGAFLGIVGKAGYFRIKRIEATCINCELCTKVCPVNIKVHEVREVVDAECLNCNECVNKCPVENTLVIASPSGRKKVKAAWFTVITFLVFFGIIGLTTATGDFSWKMASLGTSENLEKFDTDSIRGKYTYSEIIAATGLPKEVFMERFGLTEDKLELQLKESGIEAEEVREFIKELQEKAK